MRAVLSGLLVCLLAVPAAAQDGMARDAAGTTWQPEATPMGGLHASLGGWSLMLHGVAALDYVREETPKGGSRLGSTNWLMARGTRALGRGALSLTAMGSAETLTLGECGNPHVLATGPGCATHFIGEFQHPHPPLMELSARYARPLAGPLRLDLFGALVGEPALGPPSYMHRASGMVDPVAPISHHEINPAHASRGVLTVGVGAGRWKAEGSLSDGDAADADRFLPDPGPLTSRSARLSVNPTPAWALQLSGASIEASAGHHQGSEAGRIRSLVTSALNQRPLGRASALATTAAWARMDDGTEPLQAFLLESALSVRGVHTLFARGEFAGRNDVKVTIIEHPDGEHEHLVDVTPRHVAQLSGGYALSRRIGAAAIAVGARGSVSFLPDALLSTYGKTRPLGFALYLSLLPAPAATASDEHEHHHEAAAPVAPSLARR